jgi:transcriptional repressor NrdR
VTEEQMEALVVRVERRLRRKGPEVGSQQVGLEVLQGLQKLDQIGYLRFASVYKDFQEVGDFERELGLLQKREPAKRRAR